MTERKRIPRASAAPTHTFVIYASDWRRNWKERFLIEVQAQSERLARRIARRKARRFLPAKVHVIIKPYSRDGLPFHIRAGV
jgi:hypothetical protein